MKPYYSQTALAAGLMLALAGTAAQASHFRGAAMVPGVDANGLLTVTTTSFWRPTAVSFASPVVTGVGGMAQTSVVTDTSDSRFTTTTQVHTLQLTTAGTYDISWGNCCRVGGIRNWVDNGLGSSSTPWTMNSTIVWDGQTANTPILFDFGAIQPEVVRGANYSDSLGAVSGSGLTLSYDMASNFPAGVPQPPGYNVDPNTGQITIPAADTSNYNDNATANIGADYAFSGNIQASDGSSVEFDWLFDAVNVGQNLAPNVDDAVVNALVGDQVMHTMTGSDPDGDLLTWNLLSFFGPGASMAPTFDPLTQLFSWDTSGSTPGTYIANIRASDGSLTDVGTLTINLSQNGTTPIPEPGTLLLTALGLVGLGLARRRRLQ